VTEGSAPAAMARRIVRTPRPHSAATRRTLRSTGSLASAGSASEHAALLAPNRRRSAVLPRCDAGDAKGPDFEPDSSHVHEPHVSRTFGLAGQGGALLSP